jgi:hypothetical protein
VARAKCTRSSDRNKRASPSFPKVEADTAVATAVQSSHQAAVASRGILRDGHHRASPSATASHPTTISPCTTSDSRQNISHEKAVQIHEISSSSESSTKSDSLARGKRKPEEKPVPSSRKTVKKARVENNNNNNERRPTTRNSISQSPLQLTSRSIPPTKPPANKKKKTVLTPIKKAPAVTPLVSSLSILPRVQSKSTKVLKKVKNQSKPIQRILKVKTQTI